MSVLSRSALEQSPLADLHTIAGELGLDGYRRLRKADLIDRILERGGGESSGAVAEPADEEPRRPRRSRRGGRARNDVDVDPDTDSGEGADAVRDDADADAEADDAETAPPRRSRARRAPRDADASDEDTSLADERPAQRGAARGSSRGADRSSSRGEGRGSSRDADRGPSRNEDREERDAEGVIELLGNGSGFLRVNPPDASEDDVYISAAQVRRCELVSGDRVAGPVRPPRRSERYPSLVRIDTINGRPADEVAEGTHFDDLPAGFATERFSFGSDDPTLTAIEWLTPIGRGSRVTITGPARAGKSEALRRLALALRGQEGVEVTIVLTGVRPEEVPLWADAGVEPRSALTLASSSEAQAQSIDRAVDTARRVAARGGNAVVLIDTIDAVHAATARRALAAARNIVDGGSLTIVATSGLPVGGETTVIALDAALTAVGRFPALDIVVSGTMRPELLVGQAGADAIAQARADAAAPAGSEAAG